MAELSRAAHVLVFGSLNARYCSAVKKLERFYDRKTRTVLQSATVNDDELFLLLRTTAFANKFSVYGAFRTQLLV